MRLPNQNHARPNLLYQTIQHFDKMALNLERYIAHVCQDIEFVGGYLVNADKSSAIC